MGCKVYNKDYQGNEIDIDKMVKKFKRLVDKEEIIYECRKHEYFLPRRLRRVEKQKKNARLKRKGN